MELIFKNWIVIFIFIGLFLLYNKENLCNCDKCKGSLEKFKENLYNCDNCKPIEKFTILDDRNSSLIFGKKINKIRR